MGVGLYLSVGLSPDEGLPQQDGSLAETPQDFLATFPSRSISYVCFSLCVIAIHHLSIVDHEHVFVHGRSTSAPPILEFSAKVCHQLHPRQIGIYNIAHSTEMCESFYV
jgi:hypothetical protein